MKAAVVKGNCLVEIDDVAEPVLSKATQVKIKVEKAAICNATDNRIFATDHPEKHWPFKPFPFVIGHECSGFIVEKGSAVSAFAVGDRIVYWTVEGGAFAEYLLLDTADATAARMSPAVDADTAAIMEMVIGSARLLFDENGAQRIGPRDTVLVVGLGPAGLIYTRLAQLLGARRVVCAGRSRLRLDTARKLGAEQAVDVNGAHATAEIREALGEGADVMVDATGGDVVSLLVAAGKPGARVIPYGIAPFDWKDRIPELTRAGLPRPVFSGHETARHAIRWCIRMAEENLLGLSPIITHRLPLQEVGRGLNLCRLEKETTLKVIISIDGLQREAGRGGTA